MNSTKYNFIRLKNEMESYVRIGEEGFEKSYVPLHGGRGVKNCQNHPYVINEWSLSAYDVISRHATVQMQ